MNMTNPNKLMQEFDEKFIDIMGLETDPDGRENMYLIYDQYDVIQHGIDFDDEREQLKKFHLSSLTSQIEELGKEVEGMKRKTDLSLMELSQANDCGYNSALSSVKEKITRMLDELK
jgi:hypothetical protein